MSKWIKCTDELPPNDDDFEVKIMFTDGYIALSDGGTVCRDIEISKQIEKWRLLKNTEQTLS